MASVTVHIVPRARATAVVGMHGDAIKIRVAAPPVEGAANAELVRFLARRLRVPESAVTITHGTSGRRKTVAVAGVASTRIERALLAEGPE
jgi:uncharacterized protein (TIGR00251 family)